MKHDPQPASASAWRVKGELHAARGELDVALHCFNAACALDPNDASIRERMGATCAALGRFPQAVQSYQAAVALDPDNADLRHGLGWSLEQMHRLEEAADAYRHAIRLNPLADGSHNNLGNCLQALGRFEAAHQSYRRAIDAAPQVPLYYRNLVQTQRLSVDDPVFAALERLVARAASLTPANQAELHFAYGQALCDTGSNDASFDHFLIANALHRASIRYNEADTLGLFTRLSARFPAGLLAEKTGLGDPSSAPIFIVGMPRSGSTLIEQILASHPRVFGGGERTELSEALVASIRRDENDPLRIDVEAMHRVGAAQLGALGADYLRRMRDAVPELQPQQSHDTDAASRGDRAAEGGQSQLLRFTDKYPFNFINIGLIHLALPNARFIHSRRSPLQTCLSIFARLFHDVPFGYDLGELGRYYRAYDALMAHWQRVLPEGVMIEVNYEELVDDFEGNVRRLLAHCGLEWDERCLAFHQTSRRVSTASSAQVRRPLYKTSVRRWQPRDALLQPLIDGLGPRLAARDRVDLRASTEHEHEHAQATTPHAMQDIVAGQKS
ncbi:sulfotransferase [Paraburkholderia sp. PREW-6R]|uniref:tetratricopeptide repeat-containing sulfotransferase family protein n=1 Tax=Paraburkholderia sp. PREW-6R TaxID=3141544 RepID=UPI0031F4D007